MKNQIQLITYVDRIGCSNFEELNQLLQHELSGLFGGVHVLPFFDPIDGEDAGFDPIDHKKVDPRLGDWTNVGNLGQNMDIMADLIVNHVSADSTEFKHFLEHGDDSEYAPLFLTFEKVFPQGANEEDLLSIYRPRPGFPFTKYRMADGTQRLIWTTFTPKQIDIDVNSKSGLEYLDSILGLYQQAGISMIRLDAAGYAIKKPGTSCFMIPETFDFIDELTQKAKTYGIEVLVEIHSYYKTQIKIAQKVDYVYDFALPVLVLDTLFNKTAKNLKHWLEIAPRNVVTVLDTHDGIGIVDVASENGQEGLIPDQTLEGIVDQIHKNSEERSRKATGAAASNLDLYQVNCTYFEALGKNENAYLIARAIQFFVPGVPQVYYVGVFGDENDMELLASTNVGRDINRHYYTKDEILDKIGGDQFKKLSKLMKLRNGHEAFNGEFKLGETNEDSLEITWTKEIEWISLKVNLKNEKFEIKGTQMGKAATLMSN
ncbi:sucrose phosphorylase [Flagellimonas nanhaiensis]|uniref:Sucrose phosphorylase n=1 Tax=Flagellimonas nanhaiensis TaxID=2292706 RepID=A0A371JND8_9FLAO|nr:sucrose phosphorylase [Allomuricauda nanhaiensis]RDY58744.1 sucrose phosphorylase [Allomuricauda nanhaiensis]